MEKLTVTLVGQGPDVSERLKAMSYAPFALRTYLDFHLSRHLEDRLKTKVFDFDWCVSPQDMASQILADKPDIVGFSVYIWNYNKVLECARNIKDAKKDTIIIFGGPQVSPVAEDIIAEHPYVDIVSFAPTDGEVTLVDIVEAALYKRDFNTVNGICYRDASEDIIKTSRNVKPLDKENTPSPYSVNNGLFDEDEEYMAIIETSRGCPCDCGYCFWGHGNCKTNYFSLSRALRDIEVAYNNSKVKQVYFADANMLTDTRRTETMLKHIFKQKRQVKTSLEINHIHLRDSTAKLMASLPDFSFLMAVQSANPEALKCIGKMRPTPEMFKRKLKELKQWVPNVKYRIDIMLGLPGDNFNGFIQTLDFVLSLETRYIVLNYPIYLLPGSRFFENRDVLKLHYYPEPPFSIIETETFPQEDIERALRITVWTQVFVVYYPAVADFLYELATLDNNRIQRVLRWIEVIEGRINLFGTYDSLSNIAVKSVAQWNKVKKALLEKASTTESASIIYSSIHELEESVIESPLGRKIRLGRGVFRHMASRGMDSVEFSHFDQLPDNITKGYNADEIRSVFSKYKR